MVFAFAFGFPFNQPEEGIEPKLKPTKSKLNLLPFAKAPWKK